MAFKGMNVNLQFSADTSKAKQSIQDLKTAIDNLSTKSSGNLGLTKELDESIAAAQRLQQIMQQAINVKTGKLDLSELQAGIKQSGLSIQEYATKLSNLGPTGQAAFSQLAQAIATAEAPLKKTSGLITSLGTSLMNVAKYQLSTSILTGITSSMQDAIRYAQDLNKSLTSIQIVSGQSNAQMAAFAERANKAAQALSTTTTQYTNAAQIFYQQGLSAEEVESRMNTVIKMMHATGDSAQDVSSYMTAIWNNFDDGAASLESYADAIAALGATTAASSSEIAEGLSKFASISKTAGLSYEYATASLATLVANTRQSADTIGNSLKTIFSRLQGLKLGETLEDGVDLNKYSAALQKVGVDVLDMSGNLKDADNILASLASKWETLSKAQQMALAQTVGGTRQYTQLISLMDHWDDMQKNLNTVSSSGGTLTEQQETYAKGWEAAKDRVTAAMEEIYGKLVDDKFLIKLTDGMASFAKTVSGIIDGMGGLKGVLTTIGGLVTSIFSNKISTALENSFHNITLRSKMAKEAVMAFRQETIEATKTTTASSPSNTGAMQADIIQKSADATAQLIAKNRELEALHLSMNDSDKQRIETLQAQKDMYAQQAVELQKVADAQKAAASNAREDFAVAIQRSSLSQNGQNQLIKNGANFEKSSSQLGFLRQTQSELQSLADSASWDAVKEKASKMLDGFDTNMGKATKQTTQARQALQELSEANGPEEIGKKFEAFGRAVTASGLQVQKQADGIKTSIDKINDPSVKADAGKAFQTLGAEAASAGQKVSASTSQYQSFEGVIQALVNAITGAQPKVASLSQTFVDSASALMRVSSLISSVSNAMENMFNGKKMSGTQQFTQLVSIITTAVFAFSSLNKVALDVGGRLAKSASTALASGNGISKLTSSVLGLSGAEQTAALKTGELAAATASAQAVMMGVFAVAVIAVTAILAALSAEEAKQKKQLEDLNTSIEKSHKEYEKESEHLKNYKSSLSDYTAVLKDYNDALDQQKDQAELLTAKQNVYNAALQVASAYEQEYGQILNVNTALLAQKGLYEEITIAARNAIADKVEGQLAEARVTALNSNTALGKTIVANRGGAFETPWGANNDYMDVGLLGNEWNVLGSGNTTTYLFGSFINNNPEAVNYLDGNKNFYRFTEYLPQQYGYNMNYKLGYKVGDAGDNKAMYQAWVDLSGLLKVANNYAASLDIETAEKFLASTEYLKIKNFVENPNILEAVEKHKTSLGNVADLTAQKYFYRSDSIAYNDPDNKNTGFNDDISKISDQTSYELVRKALITTITDDLTDLYGSVEAATEAATQRVDALFANSSASQYQFFHTSNEAWKNNMLSGASDSSDKQNKGTYRFTTQEFNDWYDGLTEEQKTLVWTLKIDSGASLANLQTSLLTLQANAEQNPIKATLDLVTSSGLTIDSKTKKIDISKLSLSDKDWQDMGLIDAADFSARSLYEQINLLKDFYEKKKGEYNTSLNAERDVIARDIESKAGTITSIPESGNYNIRGSEGEAVGGKSQAEFLKWFITQWASLKTEEEKTEFLDWNKSNNAKIKDFDALLNDDQVQAWISAITTNMVEQASADAMNFTSMSAYVTLASSLDNDYQKLALLKQGLDDLGLSTEASADFLAEHKQELDAYNTAILNIIKTSSQISTKDKFDLLSGMTGSVTDSWDYRDAYMSVLAQDGTLVTSDKLNTIAGWDIADENEKKSRSSSLSSMISSSTNLKTTDKQSYLDTFFEKGQIQSRDYLSGIKSIYADNLPAQISKLIAAETKGVDKGEIQTALNTIDFSKLDTSKFDNLNGLAELLQTMATNGYNVSGFINNFSTALGNNAKNVQEYTTALTAMDNIISGNGTANGWEWFAQLGSDQQTAFRNDYQTTAILNLASSYEGCTDAINAYYLAIAKGKDGTTELDAVKTRLELEEIAAKYNTTVDAVNEYMAAVNAGKSDTEQIDFTQAAQSLGSFRSELKATASEIKKYNTAQAALNAGINYFATKEFKGSLAKWLKAGTTADDISNDQAFELIQGMSLSQDDFVKKFFTEAGESSFFSTEGDAQRFWTFFNQYDNETSKLAANTQKALNVAKEGWNKLSDTISSCKQTLQSLIDSPTESWTKKTQKELKQLEDEFTKLGIDYSSFKTDMDSGNTTKQRKAIASAYLQANLQGRNDIINEQSTYNTAKDSLTPGLRSQLQLSESDKITPVQQATFADSWYSENNKQAYQDQTWFKNLATQNSAAAGAVSKAIDEGITNNLSGIDLFNYVQNQLSGLKADIDLRLVLNEAEAQDIISSALSAQVSSEQQAANETVTIWTAAYQKIKAVRDALLKGEALEFSDYTDYAKTYAASSYAASGDVAGFNAALGNGTLSVGNFNFTDSNYVDTYTALSGRSHLYQTVQGEDGTQTTAQYGSYADYRAAYLEANAGENGLYAKGEDGKYYVRNADGSASSTEVTAETVNNALGGYLTQILKAANPNASDTDIASMVSQYQSGERSWSGIYSADEIGYNLAQGFDARTNRKIDFDEALATVQAEKTTATKKETAWGKVESAMKSDDYISKKIPLVDALGTDAASVMNDLGYNINNPADWNAFNNLSPSDVQSKMASVQQDYQTALQTFEQSYSAVQEATGQSLGAEFDPNGTVLAGLRDTNLQLQNTATNIIDLNSLYTTYSSAIGVSSDELRMFTQHLIDNGKTVSQNEADVVKYAASILRTQKGWQLAKDSLKDYTAALKKHKPEKNGMASTEYLNSLENMRKMYADIFDLTGEQASKLNAAFLDNENNAKNLEKALAGDKDALNELQLAIGKIITQDISQGDLMDGTTMDQVQQVLADVAALEPEKLKIGTEIDQSGFDTGISDLQFKSEQAAQDMSDALSKMGVNARIVKHVRSTDGTETLYDTSGNIINEAGEIITVSAQAKVEPKPGDVTFYTLEGANANGKGVTDTTDTGRRGGGGGGRRRKDRPRYDVRQLKKPEKEIDRYHEINKALEMNAHRLSLVAKAKDLAFGPDRLKALKQENALLQQQNKLNSQYYQEALAYQKSDANNLSKWGFTFDEDGNINNYDEIYNQKIQEYNDAYDRYYAAQNDLVKKYNDGKLDDDAYKEAENKLKEQWEAVQQAWEEYQEDIDQYEDSVAQAQKALEAWQEGVQQLIANNLEQISYKLEMKVNVSDQSLKMLNDLLQQIGDNADHAADAIANLGQQTSAILNKAQAYQDSTEDILRAGWSSIEMDDAQKAMFKQAYGQDFEDMDIDAFVERYNAGTLTEADRALIESMHLTDAQMQKLQENQEALYQINNELREKSAAAIDAVTNAFTEYNDRLDHSIEKISKLQAITQTYGNIVDIVGKKVLDPTGQFTANLKNANFNMQRDNTHSLKSQLTSVDEDIAKYKAQLETARTNGTSQIDIERMEKALQEMEDKRDDVYQSWLDSWEAEMQAAADIYTAALENIVDTFEAEVAGAAGSLANLQAEFDRQKQISDVYLDEYEQIYDLSKLTRDINNSIDDSTTIKSKQALKKLLEQINDIQESGTKLSQYDFDVLQKTYELELARAELEDARETKTTVRMTRDSEGNYAYVYSADTTAVQEAEQNYEDKLYEMQKLNSDYIEEMQSEIIQAEQDCSAALAELNMSDYATYEEYQAAALQIQQDYGELIQSYYDQLGNALQNNNDLYDGAWTAYSQATGYLLGDEENFVQRFEDTRLAMLTGLPSIQDGINTFSEATSAAVTAASDAWATWFANTQLAMEDGGTTITDFTTDMNESVEDLVETSDQVEDAVAEMADTLTEKFGEATDALAAFQEAYAAVAAQVAAQTQNLATSLTTTLQVLTDALDDVEDATAPQGATSAPQTDNRTQVDILTEARNIYRETERLGRIALQNYHDRGGTLFDTGGYTGDWGSSDGKWAVLHQKEIVLNQDDTKNLLSAVDAVRDISAMIDLNASAASAGLAGLLQTSAGAIAGGMGETIEQSVYITAEFKDSTTSSEITAALETLVNKASQYANRKNG